MHLSKRTSAAKPSLSKVLVSYATKTNYPACRQADSAVSIWTGSTLHVTVESSERALSPCDSSSNHVSGLTPLRYHVFQLGSEPA